MGRLVGRGSELAQVAGALESARPVLVVGPAGIGKTAILAAAAPAAGAGSRWGGGLASLTSRPLLPLERAVGPFRGDPSPAAIARELVRRLAGAALVLDDLHLADRGTLGAVEHLPRTVRLLTAARTDTPVTDEVVRVLAQLGATVVEVGPLEDERAREVVTGLRPELPPSTVRRIVERAQGVPFYLEQLTLGGGQPAKLLRESLRAQFETLDADDRRLLGALALGGAGLPVQRLGLPPDSLIRRGLAVLEGGRLRPRHDLIAEEAASVLRPHERAAIHRWLVDLVDDVATASRHAAMAGDERLARELALRAADAARDDTDRTLQLAFAASLADGPDGDSQRMAAARSLLDVGHPDGVEELLAPVSDPRRGAEALLLRARAAFELGDTDAASSRLDAALGRLDGAGPDQRAEFLTFAARFETHGRADPAVGIALAEEALDLGPTDERRLEAVFALGEALVYSGDLSGTGHLEHVATAASDPELAAWSDLILVHALETAERFDEARAAAERGAERARADGRLGWELRFDAALAWQRLFVDGDCERALVDYETLLDQPLGIFRIQAEVEYAVLLADLGRPAEAQAALRAAAPLATNDEAALVHRWGEAEISLLTGHARQAEEAARAGVELSLPLPWTPLCVLTWAWVRHDLHEPLDVPPDVARLLDGAAATEFEAIALSAAGAFAEAAGVFLSAVEAWTLARYRIRCTLAAGEAAQRAGERDLAVDLLATAADAARERGFRAYEARAAGGPRPRPRVGDGSALTPREREVLELVGDGMSSREIAARLGIRPVTVDSQVRSAMRKLGARSRLEAAVLARRDERRG